MLGKSQAPEHEQAKPMELRANAKATPAEVAKAKQGVTNKGVTDKMDKANVTRAELRDARIEWMSGLPKRSTGTRGGVA